MRIRNRSILIMAFQGITQVTQLTIGVILVRIISKEMLGDYRQVMLVYTLIVGICTIQIESSLYYFMPKYGSEKRRELVAQSLLSSGFISLVVGLSMLIFADLIAEKFNNPELSTLIRIFSCFPLFERIVQLLPAFLISLDKTILSCFYSMLSSVLMVLSVATIFLFGYGIAEALYGKIFIEALFAVLGILLMIHFSPLGNWRIKKSLLFEQWRYCFPLMVTTSIGMINLKLDGVLISYYFSNDIYAVYSTGAMELPIIALFTSSIASAIMPNMVSDADKGRCLHSLNIWHEASRKSSFLIFPFFVFFLISGYDFIILMYTEDYSDAAWPFMIYLARLPMRVAIYGAIFRAIGQTKPLLIAAVLSFIVNTSASLTLLYAGNHGFLSYIGPSIGTFLGTLVSVIYLLVTLANKIDVGFAEVMRWKELIRIFSLSLLCGFLLWLTPIPFSDLFLRLVSQFLLLVTYFIAALIITKSLQPDEHELLKMPLILFRKLNRQNFYYTK